MILPGDKDLRVPAWFNGMFSTVTVLGLGGIIKAIWNHDQSDIIGMSTITLILLLFWFGTLFSMMED